VDLLPCTIPARLPAAEECAWYEQQAVALFCYSLPVPLLLLGVVLCVHDAQVVRAEERAWC